MEFLIKSKHSCRRAMKPGTLKHVIMFPSSLLSITFLWCVRVFPQLIRSLKSTRVKKESVWMEQANSLHLTLIDVMCSSKSTSAFSRAKKASQSSSTLIDIYLSNSILGFLVHLRDFHVTTWNFILLMHHLSSPYTSIEQSCGNLLTKDFNFVSFWRVPMLTFQKPTSSRPISIIIDSLLTFTTEYEMTSKSLSSPPLGGPLFRLKGSILCMSFLDCNGALIPYSYEPWKDEGRRDSKIHFFLLFSSNIIQFNTQNFMIMMPFLFLFPISLSSILFYCRRLLLTIRPFFRSNPSLNLKKRQRKPRQQPNKMRSLVIVNLWW